MFQYVNTTVDLIPAILYLIGLMFQLLFFYFVANEIIIQVCINNISLEQVKHLNPMIKERGFPRYPPAFNNHSKFLQAIFYSF